MSCAASHTSVDDLAANYTNIRVGDSTFLVAKAAATGTFNDFVCVLAEFLKWRLNVKEPARYFFPILLQ